MSTSQHHPQQRRWQYSFKKLNWAILFCCVLFAVVHYLCQLTNFLGPELTVHGCFLFASIAPFFTMLVIVLAWGFSNLQLPFRQECALVGLLCATFLWIPFPIMIWIIFFYVI